MSWEMFVALGYLAFSTLGALLVLAVILTALRK
jgi:hypothetical protein